MTKLVECPVVDSVPRLALVLYTGHVYVGAGLKSTLRPGFSHVTGMVSKRILGLDSFTTMFSRSHLAPSMNRPCVSKKNKQIWVNECFTYQINYDRH